jgi:O-phosphoseryl-tRNA(Sec) kinase
MEVHVEEGSARAMLLVLCGLPGAGKTTLARRLASSLTDGPAQVQAEVRHCSFDSVYFGGDDGGSEAEAPPEFELGRWRQSRAQALAQVERLIAESRAPTSSSLVVVDDNMYYRSMRHQCYLIAKKCTTHAPLRTRRRTTPVSANARSLAA